MIKLFNSLSSEKENFVPITEGRVGMYVCGPTVYNDVHLGNCRTFVNFDIIYRFLLYAGFKVRYVRNITDVGHLLDDGEDRMSKGARLDQLEPMEVAQKYTVGFHDMMRIFNALPPSIEPRATGHIPEQIEMVGEILKNKLAYKVNGSVYFDVPKFNKRFKGEYGKLSGRVVEELATETRDNLKKQDEKKNPADFAIWMKATEEHIMRWNSPWSIGFPGWHLECSAMSKKYLGETFDIHGGGYDLKFPHHENEIAQNIGSSEVLGMRYEENTSQTPNLKPQTSNLKSGARYWLHANMLLLNGKKMSKSDGNTISPTQLFTGASEHTTKSYSPMTVRFFFLQAHYRSTLDITDEALQAAEKGYKRLMEAHKIVKSFAIKEKPDLNETDVQINTLLDEAMNEMSDDFNVPKTLARLFELCTIVYSIKNNQIRTNCISETTLARLKKSFDAFVTDIFGLQDESLSENNTTHLDGVMQLVIELRTQARTNKDWGTSDKIRDGLKAAGVQLKDSKEETSWSIN